MFQPGFIRIVYTLEESKFNLDLLTDVKKDAVTNGIPPGAVGGATVTGPIDEDLFDDEDLDELEEDLENLEV